MTSKSDSWSGSKLIILTHSHGEKSQWDCWVGMLNVEADVESGLGIQNCNKYRLHFSLFQI